MLCPFSLLSPTMNFLGKCFEIIPPLFVLMILENRIISIKGEVQIPSALKPQSPRPCTLANSPYGQVEN